MKRRRRSRDDTDSKREAFRLLDELETLARWLIAYDSSLDDAISSWRSRLHSGAASGKEAIRHFRPIRNRFQRDSGCVADLQKLRAEMLGTPSEWEGVYAPVWQVERVFPHFRHLLEGDVPPYAMYFVRVRGVYTRVGHPEFWTAESSLYEDMCCAVNEMIEMGSVASSDPSYRHKRAFWLRRSAVLNAFFFTEAYLNGIALECLIEKWDTLSDKKRTILAEYDFENGQDSWLSLRDKLLRYPRIYKDVDHSPFREDSDPDVREFLGDHKLLRDAIVHASHRTFDPTSQPDRTKIGRILHLSKDAEAPLRCVDCSIRLVRKLCDYVGRSKDSLRWLYDRDSETGAFPTEAFA